MSGLLDDLDDRDPITTDHTAVSYAERMCESALRKREEQARADGWILLARSGSALNVWRTPDHRYIADTPSERIDINAHLHRTKNTKAL